MNGQLKIVLQFLAFVFFQVAILDNIRLSGYINPFLYIMFIATLPFSTPKSVLLLWAFALGFTVDVFSHTLGFHTSACVLMAFARPTVLDLISSHEEYAKDAVPSAREFGFSWFLRYSLLLVIIHHAMLFFIEMFRFSDFFQTLGRIVISSIFTLALMMLTEYLFVKK
jgi:hypothetical protein